VNGDIDGGSCVVVGNYGFVLCVYVLVCDILVRILVVRRVLFFRGGVKDYARKTQTSRCTCDVIQAHRLSRKQVDIPHSNRYQWVYTSSPILLRNAVPQVCCKHVRNSSRGIFTPRRAVLIDFGERVPGIKCTTLHRLCIPRQCHLDLLLFHQL
jgi:hypothetical protein